MTMPETKLFYIAASDEAGENLDLLVIAETADQARQHWQDYYERNDSAPNLALVGVVPGVTPTAAPGPISWETVTQA